MILLIDNYDSFTYNLVQRIGEILIENGQDPDALGLHVVRNDKITSDEALALNPSHVIVSPGPCTPNEAGVSIDIIRTFAGKVPLFGVCLGHQSIGQCFGMTVQRHNKLMHGKTSPIEHDGKTIFQNLDSPFTATRYHSLIVTHDSIDHDRFEISAWCTDEIDPDQPEKGDQTIVMALRSKPGVFTGDPNEPRVEGVQFHPESFLTTQGPRLIANFLGLKASDAFLNSINGLQEQPTS